MRIFFAGTPEFAAVALQYLVDAGHEVMGVFTQPDRPSGRGLQLQPSRVKEVAVAQGLPVYQMHSLRLDGKYPKQAQQAKEILQKGLNDGAQCMVVAAYGLILPKWTLEILPKGCFNIHASLLPRWRGAAPIHRAIEAGDQETGVTIMQMDEGLDTGAMLLKECVAIDTQDTTATLHDKLAAVGARLMHEVLLQSEQNNLQPVKQPQFEDEEDETVQKASQSLVNSVKVDASVRAITYAHKISKQEAWIDWQQDAASISRRIRAFNPFPVACSIIISALEMENALKQLKSQDNLIKSGVNNAIADHFSKNLTAQSIAKRTLKIWQATALSDEAAVAYSQGLRKNGAQTGRIVAITKKGVEVLTGEGILQILQLQRPGAKRMGFEDFVRGQTLQEGDMLIPLGVNAL